jgi:hypothetical protein
MVKKLMISLFTCLALIPAASSVAQTSTGLPPAGQLPASQVVADTIPVTGQVATEDSSQHIAIFTPLYLDSAFDVSGTYRYDAKTFPKLAIPGLEFWEGAELAIDSLEREGLKMNIHVYDTRMPVAQFDSLLNSEAFKRTDLIIGHVTVNEAARLARLAATMDIPFINANLPNDAGITNNPHYVILNPTLPTHVTGIYRFLQKNHSLQDIVVFRKKGALEDRLKNYFTDFEKTTAVKLKMKWVTLDDYFTVDKLKPYLNPDGPTVCLAGSLDAAFAQNLCQQLASVSTAGSPNVVVGMPTWDVIDFEKTQYKNLEIVYSTPFYVAPTGRLAASVHESFKNTFYSRPSDMVFRGFETLYHFAHLLQQHGKNLGSSVGMKGFMLFGDFDVQPVINRTTMTLDYFENKKLYFVKKADGVVKTVY